MRNTTKRLAIGSVVAGVAGYVAGILTAPKSGKETRKDVHDVAQKAKVEAEKKLKTLHNELDSLIKKGTTKASQLKNTARGELVELLGKAQLAKDKARHILSAVHEGVADDKDLQKAVVESNKAVEHLKKYLAKKS